LGEDRSDDLGIEATRDCFHSVGTFPDGMAKLNNNVTDGAMLVAVHFSIVAETTSGPIALDLSRVRRKCSTSSVAHKSC